MICYYRFNPAYKFENKLFDIPKPQRGDILVEKTLYFEEAKPCKGDIFI
jgi:hypothetical protein